MGKRGFTLIEMIGAIAIIGILAIISIPMISRYMGDLGKTIM